MNEERACLLPYTPRPLPDEILGSWLARTALVNGRGAWRAFLEANGQGRRLQRSMFDIVAHSTKFEALLRPLGFSYQQAMMELTTLPYWLTFDADALADSPLPGTMGMPNLGGHHGRSRSSMTGIGIARTSGSSLKPRYCPRCLEEDVAECGIAYWHRTHQIPNVIFCQRHKCFLQAACPSCGASVVVAAKRLIPLPCLHCTCGQSLCKNFANEDPQPAYLTLARLSAEALVIGLPHWDRDQVRFHLRAVLNRRSRLASGQYKAAIEAAFGKWRCADRVSCRSTAAQGMQHPQLKLGVDFCSSGAPECCALMTALGLEFADVIPEFAKASTGWCLDNRKRVDPSKLNVRRAREELLRQSGRWPERPPSRHRHLYWFLRLNDSDWLRKKFPEVIFSPIPSIEQDRRDIQSRAKNATMDFSKRRTSINNSPAGLRAIVRDGSWLRQRLAVLRNDRTSSAKDVWVETLRQRASALKGALEQLLKSERRPVRVYAASLGTVVGLSQSQAGDAIRAFPELKAAIDSANDDKYRRQVLWAARQLHMEGHPLSTLAILKKASLPPRVENNRLARAAATEIYRDAASE